MNDYYRTVFYVYLRGLDMPQRDKDILELHMRGRYVGNESIVINTLRYITA
jgi:hypothetical protein